MTKLSASHVVSPHTHRVLMHRQLGGAYTSNEIVGYGDKATCEAEAARLNGEARAVAGDTTTYSVEAAPFS